MLFGQTPRLVLGFSRSYSRAQVYSEIAKLRLLGETKRNTGQALLFAKTRLFNSKPRCGRRRVLILITTGTARDDVVRPARVLHAVGVEVYSIGVGSVSFKYLRTVSTNRYHAFVVSARRLVTIVRTVKDKMCYSPG